MDNRSFFRWASLSVALALALALGPGCESVDDDDAGDDDSVDCSFDDLDGDGLDGCDEGELGTDPDMADTDGDGFDDGQEADCVSDPLDATEVCYACGWAHDDPGDLVATGSSEGDVVENITFEDQCLEEVDLWDFAGDYHIMWFTAAW